MRRRMLGAMRTASDTVTKRSPLNLHAESDTPRLNSMATEIATRTAGRKPQCRFSASRGVAMRSDRQTGRVGERHQAAVADGEIWQQGKDAVAAGHTGCSIRSRVNACHSADSAFNAAISNPNRNGKN